MLLLPVLLGGLVLSARGQEPWGGIRIDCHPEYGASQESCQARGCIWQTSSTLNEPFCYFDGSDPDTMAGYDVTDIQYQDNHITATLSRRTTPTIFGGDINTLRLEVIFQTDYHVDILITSASSKRFQPLHYGRDIAKRAPVGDVSSALYTVDVQKHPFGIAVTRKSSGTVL